MDSSFFQEIRFLISDLFLIFERLFFFFESFFSKFGQFVAKTVAPARVNLLSSLFNPFKNSSSIIKKEKQHFNKLDNFVS